MPVSLGFLDPDTFLLRTSQASLFQEQCPEWSESWPDSGMWDAGAVYELQSSEPVTSGSGCSLWPTAVANDAEKRGDFDTERSPCLAASAMMWPTARAEDSESCGNHPGATDSLTGATRNWPTPQEHDKHLGYRTPQQIAEAREQSRAGVRNLNDEAAYWATPQEDNANNAGGPSRLNGTYRDLTVDAIHWQTPGTDSFRSRGGDRKDEMGLDQEARTWRTPNTRDHHVGGPRLDAKQRQITIGDQAATWQTPNARDWKSETGSENNNYDKTPNLSRQVYRLSHPAPVIPDGLQSSESVQTSRRRLNPRFVEWLLGFPIGWTEL